MKLTDASQEIRKFTNKYKDNINYKGLTKQRVTIMKELFGIMKTSYRNKPIIQQDTNYAYIQPTYNYSIPETIRDDIQNKFRHMYKTVYVYDKRIISVQLYNDQIMDDKHLKNIHNKIQNWLYIATKNAQNECSSKLDIHIYFTKHKKYMPDKHEPIDTINANTAFTTACTRDTDIHIFRSEEWFKVLIHETFHSLGLDFSNMNDNISNIRLQNIFSINTTNLRLYESYCEAWAEIWNLIIISFYSVKDKTNFDIMVHRFECMLQEEIFFSMYQAHKVLSNSDITYKELVHTKENVYVEKTKAFSYFIVKPILLYNINDFLTWCKRSNKPMILFKKTDANIEKYCDLIEKLSKDTKYINDFRFFENNSTGDIVDENSLRMTVFEFI